VVLQIPQAPAPTPKRAETAEVIRVQVAGVAVGCSYQLLSFYLKMG